MAEHRILLIVATSMVLAGATACGTTTGTAQPAITSRSSDGTSSSNVSATSTTTSASKPSTTRPRAIKLDGIQPCELLTATQQKQLGIDAPPSPGQAPAYNAIACDFFNHRDRTGLSLTTITKLGIDRFQPGKVRGEATNVTVAGYPAVQGYLGGLSTSDFCTVDIDIADGQVLEAFFSEAGATLDKSTLCTNATRAAEAALATLLARG